MCCDAAEREARDSEENRRRRAVAKDKRLADKAAEEAWKKEREMRSYTCVQCGRLGLCDDAAILTMCGGVVPAARCSRTQTMNPDLLMLMLLPHQMPLLPVRTRTTSCNRASITPHHLKL